MDVGKPGYGPQLLLDDRGIAVDPLEAVHVSVQDLNHVIDQSINQDTQGLDWTQNHKSTTASEFYKTNTDGFKPMVSYGTLSKLRDVLP